MPRSRPPFPAAAGVGQAEQHQQRQEPVVRAGDNLPRSEWFSSFGVNRSTGTAIICLSGAIRRPGLYEVPMGVTLRQIIEEIGGGVPEGRSLKLLQTGGPLGGVLGADSLDIHLDFEEMSAGRAILGSGGVIVADDTTCAVDMTRILVAFCQYESCGKCFPCRLGMTHMLEVVERIASFEGRELRPQADGVGRTDNAGLGRSGGHGQLGFNPIKSALTYFEADFRAHIEEKRCPAGRCPMPRLNPQEHEALRRPAPTAGRGSGSAIARTMHRSASPP